MKKFRVLAVLFLFALLASFVFASTVAQAAPSDKACWGQATKVFARTGEMGAHASQQPTPRLGLRNLARALYEQGVLPDDTMQALGAFVASELGLEIDACM
jgi:hypothetical protein